MTVKNNLAHYRLTRGLSAIEMAKSIGVSRQTIYAMETGTYVPNTLLALRLSQVLGVKVEDLFQIVQHLEDYGQLLEKRLQTLERKKPAAKPAAKKPAAKKAAKKPVKKPAAKKKAVAKKKKK